MSGVIEAKTCPSSTAEVTGSPPPFFQPNVCEKAASSWRFDVTPYMWALNMNGRTKIANQTVDVSQSFSDILRQLNGAGMLWLDAYYDDRLGIFLNSLYAVLENKETMDGLDVSERNKFGLFSAGVSYKVFSKAWGTSRESNRLDIEPYVGARYTLNDTKVTVGSVSASENQSWTDPLIGVRFSYLINPRWSLVLGGNVGGTNMSTDTSYELTGLVGYHPASYATVYLGYHDLYQKYSTGQGLNEFDWQMRIFGPVLGVAFRFN
ncbi:MAG: hypothetical protein HY939_00860 [Gammaproteobacteria bacterium]|nr:hypothetical protein [Gammaproteobacteria bacterium]